jgi:hypothetical protein
MTRAAYSFATLASAAKRDKLSRPEVLADPQYEADDLGGDA